MGSSEPTVEYSSLSVDKVPSSNRTYMVCYYINAGISLICVCFLFAPLGPGLSSSRDSFSDGQIALSCGVTPKVNSGGSLG